MALIIIFAIHKEVLTMDKLEYYQTQSRGSNDNEYQIYLACCDDGHGNDFRTGQPLKTFDEWINS